MADAPIEWNGIIFRWSLVYAKVKARNGEPILLSVALPEIDAFIESIYENDVVKANRAVGTIELALNAILN